MIYHGERAVAAAPPSSLETAVTKSELINLLAERYTHLAFKDVESAVKGMIDHMTQSLSSGERIEIRGFGSFSLHYRPPRVGRNPKTGDSVELDSKFVPHFKPGKELRDKVNESRARIDLRSVG